MAKSNVSSDDEQNDARETTDISPNVENFCKLTFKWSSLLLAEISGIKARIKVNPREDAQLLEELQNALAALDDEEDIMKSLTTIDVKLKNADVEKKRKKSCINTPLIPSKKRRTANVLLPIHNSKGIGHTIENIAKFVNLFKTEAVRLNRKNEFGSAGVSKIYQLELDAATTKDFLLEAREKLKNIINTMKAIGIST